MLDRELSLKDIFESSGSGLRNYNPQGYVELHELIESGRIVYYRKLLEPVFGGILADLYAHFAQNHDWDELSVSRLDPRLGHIKNGGGRLHAQLCYIAAAWLIDSGYVVASEATIKGYRVDVTTQDGSWRIECGESSPQAVPIHLDSGNVSVGIIPFQADLVPKYAEMIIFRIADAGDTTHTASRYVLMDESPLTTYINSKRANTIRAQLTDLETFVEFMKTQCIGTHQPIEWQTNIVLWRQVDFALVEGFVTWMLDNGYAIGTINRKLSTIKVYAQFAAKASVMGTSAYLQIRNITSYSQKEGKRIDQRRQQTRIGEKKAQHVRLTPMLAQALKNQPDTPQGRRDRLMMCLLLDHGLRVGEVAMLKVDNVDLNEGTFSFFRPKVDRKQKHRMSEDTSIAMRNWFVFGDAPATGALLRASRKDGSLWTTGMTERAITGRVALLGEQLSIEQLSAHDCRHYWATHAVQQGTDAFALKDAGGWNSIAMPSRYVEASTVANERVKI